MAKLVLQPDPTFQAKVEIVRPGVEPGEVVFTFKHRTRAEMLKLFKDVQGMDMVQMLLAIASAWDLADEFNEANLRVFADNFVPGPDAVFETYVRELQGTRTKN